MGVSPAGDFWGGLATGIFDRQREIAKEAQDAEDRQRKETVGFLASMLDSANEDTRPYLLKQIGDVMTLKGKPRSFWDRLTGQGVNNTRDALHDKTLSLLGNIMGTKEYEGLKPHRQIDGMQTGVGVGGAPGIFGIQSHMTPDKRTGQEIAIEHPFDQKLREIHAKAAVDRETASIKLQDREELLGQRQQRNMWDRAWIDKDKADHEADLKAEAEIRRAAKQFAVNRAGVPDAQPTNDEWAKAATTVMGNDVMKKNLILSRIGVNTATVAEKKANVAFMQGGEGAGGGGGITGLGRTPGLKPNQAVTATLQERDRDQRQQQAGAAIFKEYDEARSKADAKGKELDRAHKSLQAAVEAKGLYYDAKNHMITDKNGKTDDTLRRRYQKELDNISALEAEKDVHYRKMVGHYQTLSTQYKDYYTPGAANDPWWIEPSKQFGGVAPGGSNRATPEQPRLQVPGGSNAQPPTIIPYGQTRPRPTPSPKASPSPKATPKASPTPKASANNIIGTPKFGAQNVQPGQHMTLKGRPVEITSIEQPSEQNPFGRIFYKFL